MYSDITVVPVNDPPVTMYIQSNATRLKESKSDCFQFGFPNVNYTGCVKSLLVAYCCFKSRRVSLNAPLHRSYATNEATTTIVVQNVAIQIAS